MALTIIQVNNFLTPFGGAEDIVQKTKVALESSGQTVHLFGTRKQPFFDPALATHPHLPSYIDYDKVSGMAKLTAMRRPFYNTEAKEAFRETLKTTRPDVVHFHNIHWHLSPSVIKPCVELGIPTVMTLHEARNICPAGTLMRGGETFCKELLCTKKSPLNAIKYKCYDGSLPKSGFVAAEFLFRDVHHLLDQIDHFIAPSQALRNLAIESGISSEKISVVSNPLEIDWLNQTAPTTTGDYFLFAGRLSQEKGVHTLLDALAFAGKDVPLKIAGTGDQADALKKKADNLGLTHVEFLGFTQKDELKELYRHAIATIVPSEWFETFGLTVIESMACGRPVIATNNGGPKNIIEASGAGALFEMKNANDLAQILKSWHNDSMIPLAMGSSALRYVNEHCTLSAYTESLMDAYAIAQGRSNSLKL